MQDATSGLQLIGRSKERALLRAMIDLRAQRPDIALVLLGDAGTGKTALLADLERQADACGLRLLSVTGRERDSGRPFAGLQRLLRPAVLDLLTTSGEGSGDLRSALGLGPPTADPDRNRVAAGLAELLARHAGNTDGVLVLVDDAHWLDDASLEVLALATHSLNARLGPFILAGRGCLVPAGFEHARAVPLGPLSETDARELLSAQPDPPARHLAMQVIDQAEGNPLALVELARAVGAAGAAGRNWSGLPLPLTDRLSAVFAADLGKLHARTRRSLLLASVADRADRTAMIRATRGLSPAVLRPAEELGLIAVDALGVHFRHPLVRSAIYHDAPFAARAAAHRELAVFLRDQPDRRAWHLAAASLLPDEDIASLLAVTAAEAGQRRGETARSLALERAADLSADPGDQARRLVAAAEVAASAGHPAWARELASRALDKRPEPALTARVRRVIGWTLACDGRYGTAAKTLLGLARETARRDPGAAWKLTGLAATAAYHSGEPAIITELADAIAAAPPGADGDDEAQAAQIWALAVAGETRQAAALLGKPRDRARSAYSLSRKGAAAWLLHQTADAIECLQTARDACTSESMPTPGDGPQGELGWAYLDAGHWDEALDLATAAQSTPGIDIAPAIGYLLPATIEAARGNTESARKLVATALAAGQDHGRLVTARARHALGLAAIADGDFTAAFDQLRQLFSEDGTPYHCHASYLAIGDLAAAAQRGDRRIEGREIIKRASTLLAGTSHLPSARTRQLLARANALLADQSTPDTYPADVTADPAGDQWPFDRAQFRLEQGEWLRRRRRINDAKPVLAAAADTFRALKASPWAHRAEAELRACGIFVPGTVARAAGLQGLTSQQRQIVGLAAQGLSNREIAQRMYLSPRTVGSHLYRSFPKLGIAARHQLPGVISEHAGSDGQ
jgi:DNA-binding CsgD family transcriptional regulator